MTTLPPSIEQKLNGLTPVQRAYALAKVVHEQADEESKAEMAIVMAEVESRDPEPQFPNERPITDEMRTAWRASWDEWSARNKPAYDKCDAINKKHKVHHLRKLLLDAEELLVNDVADRMKAAKPNDYARIAPAFEAWRDHTQKLVEICWRCPA